MSYPRHNSGGEQLAPVLLYDDNGKPLITRAWPGNADGIAAYDKDGIPVISAGLLWNGSTWDRMPGPQEATLAASAERTATLNTPNQTNRGHRGVVVIVRVSALTGAPSLSTRIIAPSPSGTHAWMFSAATAITAVGSKVYILYPGITAGGDERVNTVLPRTWYVQVSHANADPITYSVDALLIP